MRTRHRHRTAALLLLSGFVLSQNAQAVTVKLDATQDNTLFESSAGNLSNGAGDFLFAGSIRTGLLRRGLIQFDVASFIPLGSTIDNVTLTLTMSRTIAGPQNVSLHRTTGAWGEGTSNADGMEGRGAPNTAGDATWTATGTGDNWSAAGGDFNALGSATTSVKGLGSYDWSGGSLIADVQSMADDPAADFGWVIVGNESAPTTAKRFNSHENSSGAPLLTIEYTPVPEPATGALALASMLGLVARRSRRAH